VAKNSLCRVVFGGFHGSLCTKKIAGRSEPLTDWPITNHVDWVTARGNQLTGAGSVSPVRLLLEDLAGVSSLGGFWGIWPPRCPPIRISDSTLNSARRDGNFEVFRVVVCRILHIHDVAYCWNSLIMGNPCSRSNFEQFLGNYSGVGGGMSTRPLKGTSLRQNTHFEPSGSAFQMVELLPLGGAN
jgi:hypothetical protein